MLVTMLKSKIHKAHVTGSELEYEGSCAICPILMDAAEILPYEQIQIYNLTNGERFTTYAIMADSYYSGIISVNGAAAHKAAIGDRIIICTYAQYEAGGFVNHNPKLVYVDSRNQIK
jgi:aspartate 1-decarboxylase